MKIKPDIHPRSFGGRYEVKIGKWGCYIWDSENNIAVDLHSIVEKLDRLELRTRQLRCYVAAYGEVPPPTPPSGGNRE